MKAVLTCAGLAPEMVWFHPTDDMQAGTVGNQLRPEVLESLFYMWRFTGDVRYEHLHLQRLLSHGEGEMYVQLLDNNSVQLIISPGARGVVVHQQQFLFSAFSGINDGPGTSSSPLRSTAK